MCRQNVDNSSSKNLYMKNCVFSESEKKKIAMLHNDNCVQVSHCSDFPPNLRNKIRVDDENGLMHFQAICYLKSGVVYWKMIEEHIEGIVLHEATWDKYDNKANA